MIQYFSVDYAGPAFEYFGLAHLGALAFLIFLNLYLIHFRHASDRAKTSLRWMLAAFNPTVEHKANTLDCSRLNHTTKAMESITAR